MKYKINLKRKVKNDSKNILSVVVSMVNKKI